MAFHLETERLSMRPFVVSDAEELSALWSERDTGTPGVERAREVIAERLARTAETGLAALPIRRRDERDHVSVEDVGDVVWLTRSLP
jgi:hypothetical protein